MTVNLLVSAIRPATSRVLRVTLQRVQRYPRHRPFCYWSAWVFLSLGVEEQTSLPGVQRGNVGRKKTPGGVLGISAPWAR